MAAFPGSFNAFVQNFWGTRSILYKTFWPNSGPGFVHQTPHFGHRRGKPAENGFPDQEVPDVEFHHLGEGGDGLHAIVGQTVAGVDLKAEVMGEGRHGAHLFKFGVTAFNITLGVGVAATFAVALFVAFGVMGSPGAKFVKSEARNDSEALRWAPTVGLIQSWLRCCLVCRYWLCVLLLLRRALMPK